MTKEEKARLAELQAKKELDEAETKELETLEAKAAELEKKADMTNELSEKLDKLAEKRIEEWSKKFLAGLDVQIEKLAIPQEKKADVKDDPNVIAHKAIVAQYTKNFAELGKMAEAEHKAMSEGTDSAGGYFVPEEFSNNVIRLAENYGIARKLSMTFTQKTDTLKIPTVTTNVAVSEKAEAAALGETQPVLGQLTLTPYKVGGIVPFTNELLKDSGVFLIPLLQEILGEQVAKHEDNAVLVGGASYSQTDILNNGTVLTLGAGDTAVTDMDGDDLLDLINTVASADMQNAGFIMSRTVLSVIQKLKTTTNEYIFKELSAAGPNTVHGYPVILSEVMPSSSVGADAEFMIFGNMKRYFYGIKESITFDFSSEATLTTAGNLWEKDMIAIRTKERFSGAPSRNAAFAVMKTHA